MSRSRWAAVGLVAVLVLVGGLWLAKRSTVPGPTKITIQAGNLCKNGPDLSFDGSTWVSGDALPTTWHDEVQGTFSIGPDDDHATFTGVDGNHLTYRRVTFSTMQCMVN